MQSFVCVEYVVECQILFSALNAIWAFRMRAKIMANYSSNIQIYFGGGEVNTRK